MKTKAQELGITKFPYCERDKNGNLTYIETSNGKWCKIEYDSKGNETYREFTSGLKEYYIG
tara:strand:- start:103 stop:285 length:183 start_codon:yes stop_codon:yes gene_type:complete